MIKTNVGALALISLGAALASACGALDKKSSSDPETPASSDQIVRDPAKLAEPCKEEAENLGRVIKRDNVNIAQFCTNRSWGNPWVPASYMTCRGIGFVPTLTEDKRGVSCRNPAGVVSLQTTWGPSGAGPEMCNPKESGKWFQALDREGTAIALRCADSGVFDASEAKSKFACNDPDKSYKTTLIGDGEGVACINTATNVFSMILRDTDYFLVNSNCPLPGKWVKYRSENGTYKAGLCNASELPARGTFINLYPENTKECAEGKLLNISPDGSTVTCD